MYELISMFWWLSAAKRLIETTKFDSKFLFSGWLWSRLLVLDRRG